MKIITMSKTDFVFETDQGDYRLKIFTDGITVEKGCLLMLGKGHIWEASLSDEYFINEDRKISRTQKNIENIINEIALKIKELIVV